MHSCTDSTRTPHAQATNSLLCSIYAAVAPHFPVGTCPTTAPLLHTPLQFTKQSLLASGSNP